MVFFSSKYHEGSCSIIRADHNAQNEYWIPRTRHAISPERTLVCLKTNSMLPIEQKLDSKPPMHFHVNLSQRRITRLQTACYWLCWLISQPKEDDNKATETINVTESYDENIIKLMSSGLHPMRPMVTFCPKAGTCPPTPTELLGYQAKHTFWRAANRLQPLAGCPVHASYIASVNLYFALSCLFALYKLRCQVLSLHISFTYLISGNSQDITAASTCTTPWDGSCTEAVLPRYGQRCVPDIWRLPVLCQTLHLP